MDNSKLYAKNEKVLESLAETVQIFSDDIGTEFGIHKCATLVVKTGKLQNLMEFYSMMETS